jgi:N utilization substance protein B
LGKASLPKKRRRAREIALQLIFELDLRPNLSSEEAIEMFPWDQEDDQTADYAKSLVRAVAHNSREIDSILREHIVGWRTERMVAVDRAAIRLALCEGVVERRVPVAVAISEIVDLAKMFGTEDSGSFVNGVLGRIVRSLEPGATETAKPDSAGETAARDTAGETAASADA